jgi:ribonuclease VapC
MFLDTSAIIEYFLEGPAYERIAASQSNSGTQFFVSPTVIFEATTVLAGRRQIAVDEAANLIMEFLAELHVDVIPANRETTFAALEAFSCYGKGRHPLASISATAFPMQGPRHPGRPSSMWAQILAAPTSPDRICKTRQE